MNNFLGLLITLVSFSEIVNQSAHAETWDLGYSNPGTVVEEISAEDESIELADSVESEPVYTTPVAKPTSNSISNSTSSSITKISTSKNTFGVETVEKSTIKIFISPVAGFSSIYGNGTVDVVAEYAFGGRVGLLTSDNLMIEGGYTYSLMNTSTPLSQSGTVIANNVYSLKQSAFDVGGKFFVLGRESRVRPFIGGGIAFSNSNLNYTSAYTSMMGLRDDFKIKQSQAMGQLGAEVAITRGIVATIAFRLNGILSHSSEFSKSGIQTNSLEAGRAQATDSLSRSASYMASIGLGIYL